MTSYSLGKNCSVVHKSSRHVLVNITNVHNMRTAFITFLFLLRLAAGLNTRNSTTAAANGSTQCCSESFKHKPRYFVLSDISNEPDDTMSFIRLLTYANQLTIEGMVATTSTWLNSTTRPDQIVDVVNAYSKVVDNLNAHVGGGYPPATRLLKKISSGPPLYGLAALAEGVELSGGAKNLIKAVDSSNEPLYIGVWGGANVLAQALQHVRATRSVNATSAFVSKLRVYAISDQDNSGAWIRWNFPHLRYIASIHGWNQYGMATWPAISGNYDGTGPDSTVVSKEWLAAKVQIGPLGEHYPTPEFIMEGDTPATLSILQNGLNSPENPNWGGWGGRYTRSDVSAEVNHFGDTGDTVIGADGQMYHTNHATIWRWREAYQNDFAARMQWTLTNRYEDANHAPVVVVNGTCGPDPLHVTSKAGTTVLLDASASYDPDVNNTLTFRYFQYKDVNSRQWLSDSADVATVNVTLPEGNSSSKALVSLPTADIACVDFFTKKSGKCQELHVILEVVDDGTPRLRSYRRIVFQLTNGTALNV